MSTLAAVLDDRSEPDHPICAAYLPFQGAQVGTTATVIMDLTRRQLLARRGPHPGTPFQAIDV